MKCLLKAVKVRSLQRAFSFYNPFFSSPKIPEIMSSKNRTVNLAIQFLPLRYPKDKAYEIVDAAIAVVQKSGLRYVVGPFETTVEGPYDAVFALLDNMQEAARNAGTDELLINMKLHRSFNDDLHITDKTGKYNA